MVKNETSCATIKIEQGKVGERAILRITNEHGISCRLNTSPVVAIRRNCSGMLEVETKNTIYRTYHEV